MSRLKYTRVMSGPDGFYLTDAETGWVVELVEDTRAAYYATEQEAQEAALRWDRLEAARLHG